MKKKIIVLSLIFSLFSQLYALDVPELKGRVNDYAGILTSANKQIIEQELYSVEQTTSSQVAVLIINSLQGENLEDYSMKVAEKWQLGQKDLDNGVLLLISLRDKKLRIEVGYGLESILTDAKCDYIIRHDIVPSFRSGNYFNGIYSGVKKITGIVKNEFDITPEELAKYKKKKRKKKSHIPVALILFILFMVLGGSRGNGLLWFLLFSGSGRGSGFGSGGGFSSGGGFGGFSGGGGSFGGGGSSGGW